MPSYRKNFLTKVIARVDFQPILIIGEENPTQFQDALRQTFPRLEVSQTLQIKADKAQNANIAMRKLPTVWNLKDKSEENKIDLSSNYIALSCFKYTAFDKFNSTLINIYNKFNEIYKPSIIKRIGLRYINEIKLDGDPFDWTNLINENLFSSLNAFSAKRNKISRAMNQVHFQDEDSRLVFQFGIFNSEFPNTIVKREFILDYDCISEEEREPADVLPEFTKFNARITDLFEMNIEDGLRKEMGEGDIS